MYMCAQYFYKYISLHTFFTSYESSLIFEEKTFELTHIRLFLFLGTKFILRISSAILASLKTFSAILLLKFLLVWLLSLKGTLSLSLNPLEHCRHSEKNMFASISAPYL